MTIEKALRRAAAELRDAGIDRARLEAEILLAHVLGVRRLYLLAHCEQPLTPEHSSEFDALAARRATRYPLPYLTGEREFMGLTFRVNEHVLIPRPETEILVEAAIEALRGLCGSMGAWEHGGPAPAPLTTHHSLLVVDVGTGSGSIAISIAHHVPEARVIATDVSAEACAVARENARRLGVAGRVEVREGDLLDPLEESPGVGLPPEGRAAVLCANLPYIPDENLGELQPEVRNWEPRLALAGGPGGLEIVRRFVGRAPEFLIPGGHLFLEIGPEADEAARLTELLGGDPRWRGVRVLRDLAGLTRVVAAVRE